MEEIIMVEEYIYEVNKALVLEYRILVEFIIDRDKLFILKY